VNRITKIVPKDDYRFEVQLENDSIITLKLENRLQMALFEMLADKISIKQEDADGSYFCTGDEVEISLNELVRLAEKYED
jgi:hypothetical protein